MVDRRFDTDDPNRLCLSDITHDPTWSGFALRSVHDRRLPTVHRRMAGIGLATHLPGSRRSRASTSGPATEHHRSRTPVEPGQYLSIRYTTRLTESGITPSVGSVGDSYD